MKTRRTNSNLPVIKVVVVGDGAVGKTCMLLCYPRRQFPTEFIVSVLDNFKHNILLDGKEYVLDLWDTAGQDDYNRLRPLVYPQTHVFLVCFNMYRKYCLERVRTKWIPEITHHCPGVKFILVGMKNDLAPKEMRSYSMTIKKYPRVIQYWVRNFSDKSKKFDVFKNFPNEIVKIVMAYSENINLWSKNDEENVKKYYNVKTCVTQNEIDEMIDEISPSDYVSCSSLTGDGIDKVFEAAVRAFSITQPKQKKCKIL